MLRGMDMSDDERVSYKDLDDDGKRERISDMKQRAAAGKEKHKSSKSSYYSWGETIRDIKEANGAGETAVAGAKWAGKSLFNIGKFTVGEVLPSMTEAIARKHEENLKNKK